MEEKEQSPAVQPSDQSPAQTPAPPAEKGPEDLIVEVEPGRTIIQQGEKGKGFYILHSGQLEVIKDGVKLAVLTHPGTIFGEMSDILNKPRTCTVKAKTEAEVIHVGAENMEDALRANPDIALKIIKTLAARLERTTQKLSDATKESTVWAFRKEGGENAEISGESKEPDPAEKKEAAAPAPKKFPPPAGRSSPALRNKDD